MRSEIKINKQSFRTISILIICLMILFLPWKSSMKIPAIYVSEKYSKIYAPYPAKIKEVFIVKEQEVDLGQNLIELYSPELDEEINSIQRKIQLTKTKINRMSGTSGNMDDNLTCL